MQYINIYISLIVLIIIWCFKKKFFNKFKLKIFCCGLILFPLLFIDSKKIIILINSAYNTSHSFFGGIIVNFKYELLIILIVTLVFFIKSKQTKKQLPMNWNNFREYILENKGLSIALSVLIIAIGMIGAGIVNFLSSDNTESFLSAFNIGGITFLALLAIGLFLISPLVNFKMKYNFIENYEVENAKFVLNTYKRANNLRTSTKGLISVQLFEIQETTYDSEIAFEFKQLWFSKNPKNTVNKLKKSEVKVPLSIWGFLDGVNHDSPLNCDVLNTFTIHKGKEGKTEYKKKYIDPIFLLALHDYLKETFYLQTVTSKYTDKINIDSKNSSILKNLPNDLLTKIEDDFQKWIADWKIPLAILSNPESHSYKSIHYVSFFNLIKEPYFLDSSNSIIKDSKVKLIEDVIRDDFKSFSLNEGIKNKMEILSNGDKKKIVLWEELTSEVNLVPYIYKGYYEGENDEKVNRCYYNLSVRTSSVEEGQKKFIILMVCDNRFIPKIDNASTLYRIMLN